MALPEDYEATFWDESDTPTKFGALLLLWLILSCILVLSPIWLAIGLVQSVKETIQKRRGLV